MSLHAEAFAMRLMHAGFRSYVLTMGTPYQASLLLLSDLLILRLLELTGQKREDMYTRYTNMK
jgi:D-arabinose 5-phosphate isomerase GutQ